MFLKAFKVRFVLHGFGGAGGDGCGLLGEASKSSLRWVIHTEVSGEEIGLDAGD